jgi:hypothetical protein
MQFSQSISLSIIAHSVQHPLETNVTSDRFAGDHAVMQLLGYLEQLTNEGFYS